MIIYSDESIFDSSCDAVVCPVNLEGVMGAGLAAEFKARHPAYFQSYAAACREGKISFAYQHVYKCGPADPGLYSHVVSFATKEKFRYLSTVSMIHVGLRSLAGTLERAGVESVGLPALGCGLGGLNFGPVSASIEAWAAKNPNIAVVLYKPKAAK